MPTTLKPQAAGIVNRRQKTPGLPRGVVSRSVLGSSIKPEPKTVADMADEMRRDYQVRLFERVLAANVKGVPVSFSVDYESGEPTPDDITRTDALVVKFERVWGQAIHTAVNAAGDARVVYEKVWDFCKRTKVTYPAELLDLPYRQTKLVLWKKDEPGVDPEKVGTMKHVELRAGSDTVELGPDKAWWFALDATALNPHGTSWFDGAPQETHAERKETKRLRRLFTQRFALGGGVAHVPETIQDEETGQLIDVFEATGEAYDLLTAGGLMCLPNNRVVNPDGTRGEYEYDFQQYGLEVKDGRPIIDMMTALDMEQLLAFGIPPKTVMEGDAVGSFAMITQQMLVLFAIIDDFVGQFGDSFQTHVVDDTVDANWYATDPGRPTIMVTVKRLADRPGDLAVQLVTAWLTTPEINPFVLSGAVDITAVLESVGVPVTDDAMDKINVLLKTARLTNPAVTSPPVDNPGGMAPPSSADPNGPGRGQNGRIPGGFSGHHRMNGNGRRDVFNLGNIGNF